MEGNKIQIFLLTLSIICTIALIGVVFYVPYKLKSDIKRCFDIATTFEKMRHSPDDSSVTSQDISSFQKNFLACISD